MKKDLFKLLELNEYINGTDYHNFSMISYLQSDEYLSDEALLNARLNNITIVNFTNCENLLRENNLIGDNDRIIVNQLEFSHELADKSNETIAGRSLHYDFLNSRTGQPVNTHICENSTITILIPMDADLLGLNLTEILELQEDQQYNLFDKEDELFNDICLNYILNKTSADTTVDYRRENLFQNYSMNADQRILLEFYMIQLLIALLKVWMNMDLYDAIADSREI